MTYELRTYTATHGKRDALLARFRDYTLDRFAAHGMETIDFWASADNKDVLIYVLRHTGNPKKNWADFQADPVWIEAKAASVVDGEIVAKIESVFLKPTDLPTVHGSSSAS
ncbi:MAG: family containing protein [Glaciihabitans sp.]|jgi:hypothetical protein|nr:family containing protein [Glaciihabitans sp.]MCU1535524.1 family containing protein [Glaciihabitans sp.]MDQ1556300.1 hypothetical protein [Actinomycetota bacterium]